MLRIIFFIVLLIGFSKPVFAQREVDSESRFKDRLYFGGNFGLAFGSFTFIDISPSVGYMITPKFSAGVGSVYQYYRFNRPNSSISTERVTYNIYGGRLFARRNINEVLFAYGEYENVSVPFVSYDRTWQVVEQGRNWIPALFVGGGYVQRLGARGGFSIMALYNLMYNSRKSIYQEPFVIRMGFFI